LPRVRWAGRQGVTLLSCKLDRPKFHVPSASLQEAGSIKQGVCAPAITHILPHIMTCFVHRPRTRCQLRYTHLLPLDSADSSLPPHLRPILTPPVLHPRNTPDLLAHPKAQPLINRLRPKRLRDLAQKYVTRGPRESSNPC
jgi:hypothetical protein